ncbi:uncharacterized protein AFUA_6G14700 [Aspergillus fumigatus Af293]|uniref:Uncharacterized protein n=1 Tax=Aspergillus fumigatus (strain ATCC MYA-4609 / CBS 101355 / FGSC A1100 / Af293) TaxID=330879 RepID=Q4WL59_ASPFU|nr:hypothetical protein AFUA_6G14700 [Aspergillus fumigatus Af293]EAL89305.1 hypothetical protein AFUA_6G14700 [Aspergillus fumigatus Af293]
MRGEPGQRTNQGARKPIEGRTVQPLGNRVDSAAAALENLWIRCRMYATLPADFSPSQLGLRLSTFWLWPKSRRLSLRPSTFWLWPKSPYGHMSISTIQLLQT